MKLHPQNKKKGFVMLTVVIIFLFITLGASFAISSLVYRQNAIVKNNVRSMQSIVASESLQEDILYRLVSGKSVGAAESLTLNDATAEATVTDDGNQKRIISTGEAENRIRKTEMVVTGGGSGAVFFGGVQAGQGGFKMSGSSKLIGNVYANGPIEGAWSVKITGDAVSAGPSGIIKKMQGNGVGGDVHANRIESVKVGGDAYYSSIHNSPVGGATYPGSPDMPLIDFPVTDEQIEEWKNEAIVDGLEPHVGPCPNVDGTGSASFGDVKINCNLTIGGSTTTTITGPVQVNGNLSIGGSTRVIINGPLQVNGNLNIDSSSVVTFTDPIWVEGNFNVGGAAKFSIDPSLDGVSLPVVVDDPSNRSTGSRASIGGSALVSGAGPGSYVIIVSQNNAAENGASTVAIDFGGGGPSSSMLLYAIHGKVKIGGSAQLTSTTAYVVDISGAASVVYDVEYEDGMARPVFPFGPAGGAYTLRSLREIQ